MLKHSVIGLDLGYVQTKAVEGDWATLFPSVVKRRSEVLIAGLKDSEGYLITGQEGSWNVGAKGSYDFKTERLKSDSDIPKLLTVLGLYHEATAHSNIDLVVSGLPVDDFKVPDYRRSFTERLQGSFRFGFGTKDKYMRIGKALTIPQSAGAYFDFILSEEGEANLDNLGIASEDVIVLDIGGKSTDGCIMESGAFSQDSFTVWQGVWKVHNELRKLIMKVHHYNVPPHKLDEVLRSHKVRIGDTYEDVADLCRVAVETVFPELRDELSLYVPDFRRFSVILLAGGGAYVYYDYIRELAGIPVIRLKDAEYSNANGYRKYGLLKLKEGLV